MIDPMSLEEMKTYMGAGKVPEDFDDFRESNLDRIYKLKIDYDLIPRDFNIPALKFYDLVVKNEDGSRTVSKAIFPKSAKKVPVVFYYHGYQEQSPDRTFAFPYAIQGYGMVMMDCRGQAGVSRDFSQNKGVNEKGDIVKGIDEGPDKLYYKDVYLDACKLVKIVSSFDFVDENSLISHGGSQGGALAIVANALTGKIKQTVVRYPFLSDFRRVISRYYKEEAYDDLYSYFKYRDPFHITEERVMKNLDYIDVKNFAHLVRGDFTMVTGLEDTVCRPSTQFAIYNRLTCKKEYFLLPEYGHESLKTYVSDFFLNKITGSTIKSRAEDNFLL